MLFTGLCAAFAFRMRTWNIGGEGQLYMGAVGASAVGLVLGDWPRPLLIIAMVIGGALAGMLWLAFQLFARVLRTNEILHLAHAQLRRRILHVLPDLRQQFVLAGLDHPRCERVPDRQDARGERQLAGITSGRSPPMDSFSGRPGCRLARAYPLHPLRVRDAVMGDSPQAANYSGIRTKRKILSVMRYRWSRRIAGSSQIGDFGHVLDPAGSSRHSTGTRASW